MTSETPCSASITKPTGTTSLIGQRSRPPALLDELADGVGLHEERPGQPGQQQAGRDQEAQRADQIEPELAALGEHQVEDFDPHMLIFLEGVGRAEHHQDGKHVPLQFQPAIGAVAERIANHRIGGADHAGRQNQPVAYIADFFVEPVDPGAERQ